MRALESPGGHGGRGRHRFALLVAASTFALIFAGALVTSTGSGLAVPDWPLSFGGLFPPMRGGVIFEHGHRMVAAVVGILTAILAVWTWLGEARRFVRRLAGIALGVVVLQALLGGITVLWRLPTWVSVAHACLAQTFFCLAVSLAILTGGEATSRLPRGGGSGRGLTTMAVVATAAAFLQLILGALVRHLGAGLAIRDFPLAQGRILPRLSTPGVTVHYLHRVGALVLTACLAAVAVTVFRHRRDEPRLVRPAALGLVLLAVQIGLGGAIIWLERAVVPTSAHVAVGAGVLACCLVLAIHSAQSVRRAADRTRTAPAAPAVAPRAWIGIDP